MDECPLLTVEWKGHEEGTQLPVQSTELALLASLLPELMKELQRLAALDQED